jgi:hypothetical protein
LLILKRISLPRLGGGIEVNNIRNMADTGVQTTLNKVDISTQTILNKADISIQTGDELLTNKLDELMIINNIPSESMVEMSPTDFINTFKKDPANVEYFNNIADWTLGVGRSSAGNTDLDSQINFLKTLKAKLEPISSNITIMSPNGSFSNFSIITNTYFSYRPSEASYCI